MGTKEILNYMKGELKVLAGNLEMIEKMPEEQGMSSYKDLALDLARVACRVNCAIANRDTKGITQIKWRQHQRELKQALKEQHELIVAIFNNEVN
ncbi:hypothetical protein [Pedobacter sp. Leaf170]|uniref:hypothetical protein n=1 Tax=Pedobacter sp. Leaf170 TaxID=2876558 RepID=UPI001E424BF5|nr:hypothetical protein [Pedobacter sp. Leaf170]